MACQMWCTEERVRPSRFTMCCADGCALGIIGERASLKAKGMFFSMDLYTPQVPRRHTPPCTRIRHAITTQVHDVSRWSPSESVRVISCATVYAVECACGVRSTGLSRFQQTAKVTKRPTSGDAAEKRGETGRGVTGLRRQGETLPVATPASPGCDVGTPCDGKIRRRRP